MLLSPLLLALRASAFLPAASVAQAPHVVSTGISVDLTSPPTRASSSRVHRAVAENAVGTVSVTVETWEGFSEKDHDRFLAEFWHKKPVLIRQAVKG